MKKMMLALAACAAMSAPVSAQAASVISGSVAGPDSGFSINMSFLNDLSSTLNVTSLSIDGGTATPVPLVWDTVNYNGPSGATVSLTGVDTSVLTFIFGGDGWNPGESFSLYGVDPDAVDDPSYGATVLSLLGTKVTFGFSDSSSKIYSFVDDAADGAGLKLNMASAVPEPATWAMMIAGFGMIGSLIRRRRAAALAA
jgi:hypothetical protein